MTHRRLGLGAMAITAALVGASCGGDAPSGEGSSAPASTSAPAATSAANDPYGTADEEPAVAIDPAIQERYGPAVEALGLRITRAARYVKLGDDTPAPDGTHLAIYVEPIGSATAAAYVERIQPLADVFLPEVLDALPSVATVDVCQEPPPSVDASPSPRAYTQLLVSREQAADIDWSNVSLLDLVTGAVDHPNRLNLGARDPIGSSPAWTEVYRQAVERAAASD
jgi:hypothetical protein